MSRVGLIAGRGNYPLELLQSARQQGVDFLGVIAFKGETDKQVEQLADQVLWIPVGPLTPILEGMKSFAVKEAMMGGQIRPIQLFLARRDEAMKQMLDALPRKNADTIFDAVGQELAKIGVTLLPASRYLESRMPEPGVMTRTQPSEQDLADIRQGMELAGACASLKAGQSVAIREGTVIAVEGFEGTDRMIRRAGRVGGKGCVIVKRAQPGHDMRFDIPVVGMRTLKMMKKAGVRCMALEAQRCIMLQREAFLQGADAAGIAVIAVEADDA